jgi:hypothetical protein
VTDPSVDQDLSSAQEVSTDEARKVETSRAHEEQLERTKKEEEKISDSHSSVIEVHIDELTGEVTP